MKTLGVVAFASDMLRESVYAGLVAWDWTVVFGFKLCVVLGGKKVQGEMFASVEEGMECRPAGPELHATQCQKLSSHTVPRYSHLPTPPVILTPLTEYILRLCRVLALPLCLL